MAGYITNIFVVEDDDAFADLMQYYLNKNERYEVTRFSNGDDFLANLNNDPDIVILDHNLPNHTGLELYEQIRERKPGIKVVMLSGQQNVNIVVDAYKKGIKNYIVKGENSMIELQNCISNLSDTIDLQKELEALREKIIDRHKFESIIGESPALLKTLRLTQKAQTSNILTLITGESGTGKELIAKAIHYNSSRKRKNFIAVNLGAIPADLVESELFGHEKGAFTDAGKKRLGRFEEANGGTIFLDEIGELDINLQAKLLRVLQENIITRLGSNKEIRLDVKVIVATNKDLSARVREGLFREDLYYRLQGFLIHLPPLRERGNDIILLCKHFLQEFCSKNMISLKSFSKDAYEKIMAHHWHGNIRELRSFIERSVLLSDTNTIMPEDLVFSKEI